MRPCYGRMVTGFLHSDDGAVRTKKTSASVAQGAGALTARFHFETLHRAFHAMPVVVVFDVHYRRVALLLDDPALRRRLDSEPDDVAVGRELTINHHRSTSRFGLCRRYT